MWFKNRFECVKNGISAHGGCEDNTMHEIETAAGRRRYAQTAAGRRRYTVQNQICHLN